MGARQIDVPEIPADLPVVILNGVSSADHPCVLPAEFCAGSEIAETLVVAGHRRIGLIGATSLGPGRSTGVGDRRRSDGRYRRGPGRERVSPWSESRRVWSGSLSWVTG